MQIEGRYVYFILSLSTFIILSGSIHNEMIVAEPTFDSINPFSNYMRSIQTPSLPGSSNLTTNPYTFSPSNASAVPGTSVTEGNGTGSIPTFPTIMQAFKSQIKTSMNEATTAALNAVGENSTAVSAILQPDMGFLVYVIRIVDSSNQIHSLVVDAGDGEILSNAIIPLIDIGRVRSGPPPVGLGGAVGNPTGGYALPQLPPPPLPPIPGGGRYAMDPLPMYPGPGVSGSFQPTQPPPLIK
jgi:hypothetical protein